ncbi:MAG: DEAD/DEAH box helicase [Bacilli bacterium]|jgi:ATP-dependent RNA helicase CshB
MGSFASYNLSETMVQALKKLGYVSPTPIQEEVIPKILRGEALLAKAETGSGKTHAYLIPLIDKIDPAQGLQVVVLSPTRELARQTYEFARAFMAHFTKLKITLATGGREIEILKETNIPHVLITTPGRLVKLAENSRINIYQVPNVVLDEADMLVDAGFIPIIDQYLTKVAKPRVMAFSATFPKTLEPLIRAYILPNYIIDQDPGIVTPTRVRHHLVDIGFKPIPEMVAAFIDAKRPYLMLVFASTVARVKEVYDFLSSHGYKVGVLHGELPMRTRNSMMRRLRDNEFPVVVCSDMAARGLDIPDVSDILSVDLPPQIEFYLHRAGRTGRYKDEGDSYLFYHREPTSELEKLAIYQLTFDYWAIKEGELKPQKQYDPRKNKRPVDVNLTRDIQKAVRMTKSTEVKPGYKKKVKEAVAKVKSRHRRLAIKGKIRQQLEQNYRQNKEK